MARADTSHESAALLAMRVPAVAVAAAVDRLDVAAVAVAVDRLEAVVEGVAVGDVAVRILILLTCTITHYLLLGPVEVCDSYFASAIPVFHKKKFLV